MRADDGRELLLSQAGWAELGVDGYAGDGSFAIAFWLLKNAARVLYADDDGSDFTEKIYNCLAASGGGDHFDVLNRRGLIRHILNVVLVSDHVRKKVSFGVRLHRDEVSEWTHGGGCR